MRTKLFFLAMFASVAASAQSTVQIMAISATYTTASTIQFKVSWTNQTTANHRNKVWIFVDFQPVISPTQKGNWQPATITGTVQKTAGTVSEQSNRGFFLEGTTTNFSSTVTVQLSNTTALYNWCAYGSDYPPNVTAANGTYTLNGTPPFRLIASDGTTTQTVTGTTLAISALTITPTTIRDKTGCPDVFCPYQQSDLYIDATHLCQQRTSGAKNWEAWIKDTRDNEYYRIVLMPDNKWWLAQNIKYAGSGYVNGNSGCTPDKCGRLYTGAQMSSTYTGSTGASGYGAGKQGICPNNWILPVYNNWRAFVDAIHTVTLTQYNTGNGLWLYGTSNKINDRLCAPNNTFHAGNNYYGWNNEIAPGGYGYSNDVHEGWRANNSEDQDWGLVLAHWAGVEDNSSRFTLSITTTAEDRVAPVRCLRQL